MRYLENLIPLLLKLKNQEEVIDKAVEKTVEVIKKGRIIHIFGIGHFNTICEEFFYRPGCLVCINPIFDPSTMLHNRNFKSTFLNKTEEYGKTILDKYDLREDEILYIVSYSGRDTIVIDVALEAKKKGLFITALINEQNANFPSKHSSEKNLRDVSDLTILLPGPPEDTLVSIGDVEVGPVSNILASVVLNIIFTETAEELERAGITPPVFKWPTSQKEEESNEKLIEIYKERIKSL